MTTDDSPGGSQRATTAKERARAFRKAAYEKAKAAAKERRKAAAATPEAQQRAAALKAKRRDAYKKVRERSKARDLQVAKAEAEAATADRATVDAVRQKELLRLITTADKLAPQPPRDTQTQPKLTLVKN
ncbi:MAG: hypothetical protein FJ146_13715 [Deltaproteobacteria bacterium]|nr:hypothetical protein [Deltaproteobacteria bacterium]